MHQQLWNLKIESTSSVLVRNIGHSLRVCLSFLLLLICVVSLKLEFNFVVEITEKLKYS